MLPSITMGRQLAVAVGVAVGVGVKVAVAVAVAVGVGVSVAVGVGVNVAVAVGVAVGVWVAVAVGVGVWVAVGVGVNVAVGVGVAVGVAVAVAVGVAVSVAVGVGVNVAVAVGFAVGVGVGVSVAVAVGVAVAGAVGVGVGEGVPVIVPSTRILSTMSWILLPFDCPPLNSSRRTSNGWLLAAAGTVKLSIWTPEFGITTELPELMKVPPPSMLYQSTAIVKPPPLALTAKLSDMSWNKPFDDKRGISKSPGLLFAVLAIPSARSGGSTSLGQRLSVNVELTAVISAGL
jgi:hypothetical protein